MPDPVRRPGWRVPCLVVVLLGATAYFARELHGHYPLTQWLVFRYLGYWFWTAIFSVACVSAGNFAIKRLVPAVMPLRERLIMSFAVGTLLFATAVFVGGLLRLLGGVFFVALPALFIALGFRDLRRLGTSLAGKLRHLRAHRPRPVAPLRAVLWAAGLVAILLMYVQIISPDTLGFDARWYHLPLAEHYVAEGRIARFPEGWFLGAYPQLASYLYTWAFMLPKSIGFDHVELSYHLEFACFVWKVAAVPSLVRVLVPGRRASMAWVGLFLFPGVFLYDANLNGGADHVASIWTIPIALTLFRAWQRLEPKRVLLFVAMLSGAILTKYSVYCILPFPMALFAVRCLLTVVRPRRGEQRRTGVVAMAVAAAGGLVLTSPHWLKNLVFYGDPFYPILHARLGTLHPWSPEGVERLKMLNAMVHPAPPGWPGIKAGLVTMLTFSFKPNDWDIFHKDWPTFGSLFTLTAFALPFLRGSRRIWIAQLAGMSAVFTWYEIHHYDRFLQIVVPWMAAATVAAIVLAWESHLAARLALVPLVALQVLWGTDVPFYPTHNMIGDNPIHVSMKLAASGFLQKAGRLTVSELFGQVPRHLPRGAKVLLHESPIHLGIGAASVNDQWQGGIVYGKLGSPRAVHEALKGMGVTHILLETMRSHGQDSLAGDLVFFRYWGRYAVPVAHIGWLSLAKLPDVAPPPTQNDLVYYQGCSGTYQPGIYHMTDLSVQPTGGKGKPPLRTADPANLGTYREVAMVVHNAKCRAALPDKAMDGYLAVFHRGDETGYLRMDAD